MHRQTPLTAAFVGYSGGGARTLIDTIDDGKMMQEMKGSMMFGEARDRVESPQNYGFSSVVLPAKKGKDGQIEESAEGFMSFIGGNRSFAICTIMDDRRHRPYGMKPGENAQYDDLGQMTILRRTGLYLLSTDNPDESQQQGGGAAPGQHDGSSSQSVERMVSLRHVEKKKQDRKKNTGGDGGDSAPAPSMLDSSGGGQSAQDFKHEGESVNSEVRVTKKDVQILDGDTVVARYDKASGTWSFTSKNITLTATDAMTIECKNGQLDIKGKPIKFNDGTPTSPPFQVPG